ncbi:MAG TPA: hypothetical protein VFV33_02515 [Gemmatimonadaceae bacterium]|nr:hypothetical protein [Gemmatimonadaceae bacterium]
MEGVFNNNFLIGMLLARGAPRNEQFLAGMAAGQMPATQPVAPLFLKPISDQRLAAQHASVAAQAQAGALQQPIQIVLPDGADRVTLRVPGVPGATLARTGGSANSILDAATGIVSLPTIGSEATITVSNNGASRDVVVVRGGRIGAGASLGAGAGAGLAADMTNDQLAAVVGQAFLAALQTVLAGRGATGVAGSGNPPSSALGTSPPGGTGASVGTIRPQVAEGLADVLPSSAMQSAVEGAPELGATRGGEVSESPGSGRQARQPPAK